MKQVIVMRKDLKMRKGKMVAQGAHASLKATLEHLDDPRVTEWLDGAFTKVCVGVGSEAELSDVLTDAMAAGLITASIIDNGLTEFGGVKTFTCIAVGPDTAEKLAPVTGRLELL